ncbi:rhodanese-like domain-containing protein [Lentilactobacillus senioris]|uniref:rhodanese-like domain-containing protein n=1 Tax=Lentilactobacillus senioris TaxID=931534 RepID=UPI002282C7F9|nr:rhodanese-like domain-containing protein [Lentilactobacillus senioris]MCY9806661.1 rhodanese-like domain-containing protein [Lentilactobacillus senioris]
MFNTINTDELATQMQTGTVNLVDVREDYEFNAGHVPGAINLPLSQLLADYHKLDKANSYYLICRSGARSANASAFLTQQGYRVTNVTGGMLAWNGAIE